MRASIEKIPHPQDLTPVTGRGSEAVAEPSKAFAIAAREHAVDSLRIVWVSPGFLESTQLRPDEALHAPLAMLFEPSDRASVSEASLDHFVELCADVTPIRLRLRGDESRVFIVDCTRLQGTEPRGSAMHITLRDGKAFEHQRARRLQLENATRVVRQRIRAGTWTIERDAGDLVHCSEDLLELLAVTPAQLSRDPRVLVSRIHPEEREWVYRSVADALADCRQLQLEHRIQLPDGSTLWVQLTLLVCPKTSGPCRAIGCVVDVTERVLAHRNAVDSEQRFRAAAEASLDGLALVRSVRNADGGIEDFEFTDFNSRIPSLFTHGTSEMLGRRLCDVLPRIRIAGYLKHLIEVVERGTPYQELIRNHSEELRLTWAQVQAVRLGDGLAISIRDVSHEKSVEDRLMHAKRLEAVGQLAAGIAHDFNNMLSVVLSFDTLVYNALPPNASERKDLAESLAATKRAAELTRRLLAFSRRQILEPRLIDVDELLRDLHPILAALAGRHVCVQLDLAEGLPEIWIDPSQLEQAIVNLVTNARDAMPNGGTLSIETSIASSANAGDASSKGVYVQLRIADTGVGMSEAVRRRIFEPFFTTKNERGGTGLGLASVFGFVKQSRGNISVESNVGRGTTFTLLFAATKTERESSRPSAVATPFPSAIPHATVLVIDYDRSILAVFRRLLESRNFTVLTASNVDEALSVCRRHAGPIHAILTDSTPQDAAGVSKLTQLRAGPGIGLVLTSGALDTQLTSEELGRLNAVSLAKPVTPELLFSKLADAMSLSALAPDGQ